MKSLLKDNRSLEQFMKDYEKQKEQIANLDYRDLTEENKALLIEYSTNKEFFEKMRESLDFIKCSTLVCRESKDDETIYVSTLLPKAEDYIRDTILFTAGFNKEFMEFLEKTREQPIKLRNISPRGYIGFVDAPLNIYSINRGMEEELNKYNGNPISEISVSLIADTINKVEEYEKQIGIITEEIAPEEIAGKTLDTTIENYNMGKGNIIVQTTFEKNNEKIKEKQKELMEENEPVEIVESNDGYVLNHSKLNNSNYKELDEKIDFNTVANTQTKQTTTDPTLVGGNVKLETVKDYGTKEQEIIESGGVMDYNTEKNYFDSINKKHPDEEAEEEEEEEEINFER